MHQGPIFMALLTVSKESAALTEAGNSVLTSSIFHGGILAPALARKRRTVIVSAEFGGWQSNKINWVQTFA